MAYSLEIKNKDGQVFWREYSHSNDAIEMLKEFGEKLYRGAIRNADVNEQSTRRNLKVGELPDDVIEAIKGSEMNEQSMTYEEAMAREHGLPPYKE